MNSIYSRTWGKPEVEWKSPWRKEQERRREEEKRMEEASKNHEPSHQFGLLSK